MARCVLAVQAAAAAAKWEASLPSPAGEPCPAETPAALGELYLFNFFVTYLKVVFNDNFCYKSVSLFIFDMTMTYMYSNLHYIYIYIYTISDDCTHTHTRTHTRTPTHPHTHTHTYVYVYTCPMLLMHDDWNSLFLYFIMSLEKKPLIRTTRYPVYPNEEARLRLEILINGSMVIYNRAVSQVLFINTFVLNFYLNLLIVTFTPLCGHCATHES